MSEDKVKLRPALKSDCTEIARLVNELAEYEKVTDRAKVTKEVLEEDGFGQHKYFHCVVAENPEWSETDKGSPKTIGYALFFFTYSLTEGRGVFLKHLYVSPQYRAGGIGYRLTKAVAKKGVEKDCSRLCWTVLDWNVTARAFYMRLGTEDKTETEGWHTLRLNKPELEKLANS